MRMVRWGRQFSLMISSVTRSSDHRAGYPVAEVSQRLGVSLHSLYAWKRTVLEGAVQAMTAGMPRSAVEAELARVTEERDILKKATAYFARDAK
jgi:transposase